MTTKVVDSTVSQLLQDNSSVEYGPQEENPIALNDLPPETVIKGSLITEKQYRMCVANLFGFEARVIVTNPKDIKDPRSTWWCLADTGSAIGSSRSGSLLGLLHRRERDSRIFTNDEIIFDDFRSKDTLPLNNRGQTFVSLSGFLEILSKTELSSDKIDDFQEEIFWRVLPIHFYSPLLLMVNKNGSVFFFVVSMVLFSRHIFNCAISHTCREGREVKRPETSKKVEQPP